MMDGPNEIDNNGLGKDRVDDDEDQANEVDNDGLDEIGDYGRNRQ